MNIEQDTGIVLKKTIYQDNKLIVNVFTKLEGLLSFGVNLGKYPSGKLGCFEVGNLLKLEFKNQRDTKKLHDASIIFSPKNLRLHLETLCQYVRFLDTLYHLLKEGTANPLYYEFLTHGLKHVEDNPKRHDLFQFMLLKWLQQEGMLDISEFTNDALELEGLLQIRRFSDLPTLSSSLIKKIDQTINCALK